MADPIVRPPLAHRQLTVSSTAVGFSAAKDGAAATVGLPANSGYVRVQVLSNPVRYAHNDTPTTSFGIHGSVGDFLNIENSLNTVLFIREGAADATLEIDCYG